MAACWKCGSRVQDASGFCTLCGRDCQYPPRPPTNEEEAQAVRQKVNPTLVRPRKGLA